MNYNTIWSRILYSVKNDPTRPATVFSKTNYTKLYVWLTIEDYRYPLRPREAYLLCLISKRVIGRNLKLGYYPKCKSSREFERVVRYRKSIKTICVRCNRVIEYPNRKGLCELCRPRRIGELNGFFGKHHSQETKDKLHKTSSKSSKEHWKDPKYRMRVIEGKIGKKRSEAFKETQRKNAVKQMQDVYQKYVRSQSMKHSWKTGKINPRKINGRNFSKIEVYFGEQLKLKLNEKGELLKRKQVIHLPNSSKFYLPDFVYNDKYVIEFLGDYWHANPRKYKASDWIDYPGRRLQAKDIWDFDLRRQEDIENLNYTVIYVWNSDFSDNPDTVLETVTKQILQ